MLSVQMSRAARRDRIDHETIPYDRSVANLPDLDRSGLDQSLVVMAWRRPKNARPVRRLDFSRGHFLDHDHSFAGAANVDVRFSDSAARHVRSPS